MKGWQSAKAHRKTVFATMVVMSSLVLATTVVFTAVNFCMQCWQNAFDSANMPLNCSTKRCATESASGQACNLLAGNEPL